MVGDRLHRRSAAHEPDGSDWEEPAGEVRHQLLDRRVLVGYDEDLFKLMFSPCFLQNKARGFDNVTINHKDETSTTVQGMAKHIKQKRRFLRWRDLSWTAQDNRRPLRWRKGSEAQGCAGQ